MDYDYSSESDGEDCCNSFVCDLATRNYSSGGCNLRFDDTALETIILSICEKFDIRVLLNDDRMKQAFLFTSGLSLAGSMIGKHYGGSMGATLGGAVGGACGLGIAAVSMKDVWNEVKYKLSELFDIVYDYLVGLGVDDYKAAASFLANDQVLSKELASVLLNVVSGTLGKKVLSNFTK